MNFWLVKAVAALVASPLWSERTRRAIGARIAPWNAGAIVAAFALSRLIPCVLAMVVLRLGYPEDAAEWGRIATGDVWSPYAPGFNALLSSLWWIAPSPLTLVVAMIAIETAAFAIFLAVVRRESSAAGWSVIVFWLVNPLSLFHVALNGQDEVLILLTWCLVLWAVLRRSPVAAGGIGAAGLFFTKALAPVACIPLFVLPGRGLLRGLAAFAIATVAVAACLSLAGTSLFMFAHELRFLTSGNVWVVPELLGISYRHQPVLECSIAAAVILVAVIMARRTPLASPFEQALRLTGVVGVTFLLMSPKSPTAWLVLFLPGVLWLIASAPTRVRPFLLFVFLPVSVFEPSLWFLFDQGERLGEFFWSRPAMLFLDAILFAGYGLIAFAGLRREGGSPTA